MWIYLFSDAGVHEVVKLACRGSTQQQSSFKTSGERLGERPQELGGDVLQVWNQTFQTGADSQLCGGGCSVPARGRALRPRRRGKTLIPGWRRAAGPLGGATVGR